MTRDADEVVATPPEQDARAMRRVARGSVVNLAGAAVTGVANFGLSVIIARGLTKPDAGVLFSMTSLFLLASSVGQLGTGHAVVYFLSRCRALGNLGLIPVYFKAALRPVVATAIVMGICFFVFAPQLAAITNPDHQALAKSYLRVFAVFVPLAAIEQVSLAATRGLGSMRTNAIVEQLGRPTLQVGLVAGALAVPTATNLGWAWSLPYAPAALFAWLLWRRARDAMVMESAPTGVSVGREFWRFSAPRSLASVAQLAMQRFDIVLVAAIAGASEAAVYTVATRFVVAGQMARNAVSLALQPPIAQALARPESPRALALFQMSTAWLMIVTWPIYLLLAVFSGPLMQVFGHGYQEGALVLTLVALSLVISTACGDVDVVLIMAARTSWSLGVVLIGFGVNLGLDLWLIPSHGVLGAAIGWSVAIVVKNVVALGLVRGSLKLQPVARPFLIVAGLSLVWFAAVPVVVRVILGSTWTGLITSVVIGGAGFLVGVWSARRPLQLESLRRLS